MWTVGKEGASCLGQNEDPDGAEERMQETDTRLRRCSHLVQMREYRVARDAQHDASNCIDRGKRRPQDTYQSNVLVLVKCCGLSRQAAGEKNEADACRRKRSFMVHYAPATIFAAYESESICSATLRIPSATSVHAKSRLVNAMTGLPSAGKAWRLPKGADCQ